MAFSVDWEATENIWHTLLIGLTTVMQLVSSLAGRFCEATWLHN
jgi:hypothetical protein